MTPAVQIVPFPEAHAHLLWAWLHEFPEQNFDDTCPKTLKEFLKARERTFPGMRSWEVLHNGAPVGCISHCPAELGAERFCGICFTKSVHGTGVALDATRMVLERIFKDLKVPAVAAIYFEDNHRVARFLRKLGAGRPARLENATTRGGQLIAAEQVLIYRRHFIESRLEVAA